MKATATAANQDLSFLFEPDVLASNQFHTILKSSHMPDPERRLMVAILEDAVSCLSKDPRGCPRQQKKAFEEAHSWINANDTDGWVFSFTNVCETLGFDPSYLRRGLNRWTALSQTGAAEKPRLKKYRSGARRRKLRFRAAL
jgi:methylphosphotriester-DNA--protein-cysteine methyltransferase